MSEAIEMMDEQHGWVCDSDSAALWAIRKMQELDNDTENWTAFYKAQTEKIKAQNEQSKAYFTAKLQEYFDTLPKRTTKAGWQVYDLPNGASMTTKPSTLDYKRDDEQILAWAAESDLFDYFVKVVPKLNWADLKKRIIANDDGTVVYTDTGEIVPGLTAYTTEPAFVTKGEKNNG